MKIKLPQESFQHGSEKLFCLIEQLSFHGQVGHQAVDVGHGVTIPSDLGLLQGDMKKSISFDNISLLP